MREMRDGRRWGVRGNKEANFLFSFREAANYNRNGRSFLSFFSMILWRWFFFFL